MSKLDGRRESIVLSKHPIWDSVNNAVKIDILTEENV
jgi:hypothetical protein